MADAVSSSVELCGGAEGLREGRGRTGQQGRGTECPLLAESTALSPVERERKTERERLEPCKALSSIAPLGSEHREPSVCLHHYIRVAFLQDINAILSNCKALTGGLAGRGCGLLPDVGCMNPDAHRKPYKKKRAARIALGTLCPSWLKFSFEVLKLWVLIFPNSKHMTNCNSFIHYILSVMP